MNTLNTNELLNITGGGISKWLLTGIGAGIVFIASIIYGFVHPNKC